MLRFLEDISKKYGFVVSWRADKQWFGLAYSKINHNGVGVWSYRMKKEKVHVKHYNLKSDWDYNIINPPKHVIFNGIQTYVPNNVQSNNKCIE